MVEQASLLSTYFAAEAEDGEEDQEGGEVVEQSLAFSFGQVSLNNNPAADGGSSSSEDEQPEEDPEEDPEGTDADMPAAQQARQNNDDDNTGFEQNTFAF